MRGLYADYEESDNPFEGDPDLPMKANAWNVRRLLNKSGGPSGKDWFIIGQYLMQTDMLDDSKVADLAWKAQDYEGVPPFGDHEAMLEWDRAQAARGALRRATRRVLKLDFAARSN